MNPMWQLTSLSQTSLDECIRDLSLVESGDRAIPLDTGKPSLQISSRLHRISVPTSALFFIRQ